MNLFKKKFIGILLIFLCSISISTADIGSNDIIEPNKNTGENWAILAGVDNYVFLSNSNLPYSWNDVSDVNNMLINDCNFKPYHIFIHYNEQATKSKIQASISSLATMVTPSDTVIFYFTGHGVRGPDLLPYDESDGYDEYFCPQDSLENSYLNDIRDDEIQIWLEQLNAKNIICIFDVCYSGGMVKSVLKNDDFNILDFEKDINSRKFVVLMSSNDNEKSSAYSSLQNSAFTYYLIEGIKLQSMDLNGDFWISVEEAFQYAKQKTYYATSHDATPNIVANPQIFDGDNSNEVKLRLITTVPPTTVPPTWVPSTITIPPTIPPTATPVPPTAPPQFTITAIPDQNGIFSPAGLVKVAAGASQQFFIMPMPGYRIDRVIVDGVNKGSVNMFTFTDIWSDHTLTAYFVAENQQLNQINLALEPGWNFISTPKSLKEGFDSIDSVIGTTDTDNHSVYLYDAFTSKWQSLKRTSKVTPLDGIWVYSKSKNQAIFVINDITEKPSKLVYPDWNAIGCTALEQKSVKENFNSINNIWTSTIGFNTVDQLYETSLINGGTGSHSDSTIIVPGKGYWVYSTGTGTLFGN